MTTFSYEQENMFFSDGNGTFLPSGYSNWSLHQLERIKYLLMEYITHGRKCNGDEFGENTFKSYILGVARGFKQSWGYNLDLFKGPVFGNMKDGLSKAVNCRARQIQAKGNHSVSHNVFCKDDIIQLYNSNSLSTNHAQGFLTRTVFSIGLTTGFRPTALGMIEIGQFQKVKIRGEDVWKIKGTVGSLTGTSKTHRGGWNSLGEKPHEVVVFNEPSRADPNINFYKDIEHYMDLRMKVDTDSPRFFMGVSHPDCTDKYRFLKKHPVGKNHFRTLVKKACLKENIAGDGEKGWVGTHGLRGSLVTSLFEEGHADSSVTQRTGHRRVESLRRYHHLRGSTGREQQQDILGGSGLKKVRTEDPTTSSLTTPADFSNYANFGNILGGTVNVNINVQQRVESNEKLTEEEHN